MAETFHGLVANVHQAATALGMDVTPSDVGFIVQGFVQGVIDAPGAPLPEPVRIFLQQMADEAGSVKDEG